MRTLLSILLGLTLLIVFVLPSGASTNSALVSVDPPVYTNGKSVPQSVTPSGYTRSLTETSHLTSPPTLVDAQIKGGPGYVSYVVCGGSDAAATAGTLILYDSLTETGTIVYQWDVQAVALPTPITIPIERDFTIGIYLGFTTTGDLRCFVSYR